MPTLSKGISKSKEKTTFLLHTRDKKGGVNNLGYGISEVLEYLFWKNPHHLPEPALKLLEEIKKAGKLDAGLWRDMCRKIGLMDGDKIQRGKYNSIIKKLRGAGMVYKVEGYWQICPYFDSFLEQVLRTWRGWKDRK